MRCKCCDTDNKSVTYWKEDFYCGPCRDVIAETIAWDRWIDNTEGRMSGRTKTKENKDETH